ncbi:juvenile hormone esterase-like isoform X1 [Schistocerca gregaria]|uniref:juvenile hormone esterase-like isoform X1 n=1 Tax=Schistocerca gregaria TaxID=7010 RepID=UPI00211DFDA9|nr:juvenile hormone esterase-like isoform X1 [Schistocerca gregaria]
MSAAKPVLAAVRQGSLRGKLVTSPTGTAFCSFLGIPYAKPPVGSLRFKPPQPAEAWTGIRDATSKCPVAPQINDVTNKYVGNEDCLFLNVYTPELPSGASDALKPVMVWIHGGGFTTGSGDVDLYGPDYLLGHGVVVVTFNYRLGVLGFLSTGDSVVPGNMGFKDQLMALRWVKENIAAFGGDPENITLFGESAGSRSCHLIMLSSAAEVCSVLPVHPSPVAGLFQRMICQSAVAFRGCLVPMAERTHRLARHLGLQQGASSHQLADFLRKIPAKVLVEQAPKAFSEQDKAARKMFPFRPTIEPADSEEDVFMSEDPYDVLTSGRALPVPTIFGVNSQEGFLYAKGVMGNAAAWRDIDANFDVLVPASVRAEKHERPAIARAIRKFYLGDRPLGDDTFQQYSEARGDPVFPYGAQQVAKVQLALAPSTPVYFSYFDVDAKFNLYKQMLKLHKYGGAAHADDIAYVWKPRLLRIPEPTSVESRTIASMTKLWTNFAKTGNPTPDPNDPVLGVSWPTFSVDNGKYLEISNSGLAIRENMLKDRMDFWDDVHNKRLYLQ